MAISFQGAHFPPEVILMGVRWYVAYPLSTRHVEELMEERGVEVDHSTGSVSKVERDRNNFLYIKGIGVSISTFDTLPRADSGAGAARPEPSRDCAALGPVAHVGAAGVSAAGGDVKARGTARLCTRFRFFAFSLQWSFTALFPPI